MSLATKSFSVSPQHPFTQREDWGCGRRKLDFRFKSHFVYRPRFVARILIVPMPNSCDETLYP